MTFVNAAQVSQSSNKIVFISGAVLSVSASEAVVETSDKGQVLIKLDV
jgi:hypothetical protein